MNKTGLFRHRTENGIINVTPASNTVEKTQRQEKRSRWLMAQNPLRIAVVKNYNVVPKHSCYTEP